MYGFRLRALVGIVAGSVFLTACTSGVLSLEVGTCFDDPAATGAAATDDVAVVDCGVPHDNEVYAVEDLLADAYPGEDAIASRADEVCLAAFDGYIGEPYETSVFQFTWFVPSAETWGIGDREVICYAFDGGFAKITGSIAGAAR